MNIIDRLTEDIKQAMRDKDLNKKNALRALKADCQEFERVNKKELSDSEFFVITLKQIKQLNESIGIYRMSGRDDLADEASEQLMAISAYAPPQYTEEEVEEIIGAKIELGLDSSNKGRMMKELMPLFADQTDKAMIMRVIEKFVSK